MLLGNVHCENCGKDYDVVLDRCPHCKEANNNRATLKYKNKVAFMSIVYQFVVFLIGLGGLYIFNFVYSLIFVSLYDKTPDSLNVPFYAAINFTTYGSVFILLLVIVVLNFSQLKKHFVKIRPYIAGLIFGACIIGITVLYSFIMQKVYPTPYNDNEKLARGITVGFPALSILILGIIGPICEELTYRVGLFSICSRFNRYLAYAVTTIIFALIHFNFTSKDIAAEFIYLPVYLISGFLLTLCYEKEGPPASMVAHIANNLYSVIGVLIINAIQH